MNSENVKRLILIDYYSVFQILLLCQILAYTIHGKILKSHIITSETVKLLGSTE